jgi:hypothetical protein
MEKKTATARDRRLSVSTEQDPKAGAAREKDEPFDLARQQSAL